jgi:hypothetical protein
MSDFTFNDDATGDDPRISFLNLRVVDDAGGQHLEAVVDIGHLITAFPNDVTEIAEAGIAPIANIRPEHTLVSRKRDGTTVIREGTMEVKPGKQRQKIERWSRQLINESLPEKQRDPEVRRAAVLGNLSIRLNPKFLDEGTAVLYDRDGNPLELDDLEHVQIVDLDLFKDAQFDTGVDSLSRLKSAYKADQVAPGCLAGRRTSVRIWIADDEQAAAVAHAFNQEGDPVNATAAKYRHQDSAAQSLARALVDTSPHLGAKNVEVFGNTVSKNSPKLTSFNTISLAIEQNWTHTPFDPEDAEFTTQATWLVDAWDELVKVRPEFGYVNLKQRQQWRQDSLAGSGLSIHGIIGILAAIYPKKDFDPLAGLKAKVALVDETGNALLDGAGNARHCDFLDHQNPIWQKEGILVHGKTGLVTRQSFPTRKAMITVLRHQVCL